MVLCFSFSRIAIIVMAEGCFHEWHTDIVSQFLQRIFGATTGIVFIVLFHDMTCYVSGGIYYMYEGAGSPLVHQ